jgi:hypothetical protein
MIVPSVLVMAVLGILFREEIMSKLSKFATASIGVIIAPEGTIGISPGDDMNTSSWTAYTPSAVGFSGTVLKDCAYKKVGKSVDVKFKIEGTGDGTSVSFELPFALSTVGAGQYFPLPGIEDNGSWCASGLINVATGGITASCWKSALVDWVAGSNRTIGGTLRYEATT